MRARAIAYVVGLLTGQQRRPRVKLPTAVQAELWELEWDATNPYRHKSFDLEPFAFLLSKIEDDMVDALVLREIRFFDSGITTLTDADLYYSAIRVVAVDAILDLYYAKTRQAYQRLGRSSAEWAKLVSLSRKHWNQDVFLSRAAKFADQTEQPRGSGHNGALGNETAQSGGHCA